MRRISFCVFGLSLIFSGGCASTEPLGLRYGPQQPVAQQRRDAQMIDPYPLTNVGGGDMTGARPPDFDAPRSETRRAQETGPKAGRWSLFGN